MTVTAAEPQVVRTRILEEATRLFMAYGYTGISMREIAAAVGVSKAGLYYHFKDKEDLFLAILYDALRRMEQVVARASAAGPHAHGQVEALVRGLLAEPADQRALIRLAGHEIAHLGQAARAEFGQRYHQQFIGPVAALLQGCIARGELRPVEPQTLTWLLLGMLYPFMTPGGGPPEPTIATLVEVFFRGAET